MMIKRVRQIQIKPMVNTINGVLDAGGSESLNDEVGTT
jgi:hypothetical protein